MKIVVIGSGSTGNCIAIYSNNGNVLLLDLGLSRKRIVQELGYKIDNIHGAVITHEHKDHAYSVCDFKMMGIDVWKPYLEPDLSFHRFRDFKVWAFDVPHDDCECRGLLICVDGHKILYVTDAEYCRYTFKHLEVDTIIVECNYQKEYMDFDFANTNHVLRGHMELHTCIDFLVCNKTEALKNVILCHLSMRNISDEKSREMVSEMLGENVQVHIAERGLEIVT